MINDLVNPASVIASHANEAATREGKLIAGTKTARFAEAVTVPIHLPLSGKTLHFSNTGACTQGCN